MIPTLPWLISPIDNEGFWARYWRKEPLRVPRDERLYYESLLSQDELEYALFTACRVMGGVEELDHRERAEWVRGYSAAVESFLRGKSLRVDGIQRFSQRLAVFSRMLEAQFSCPVGINMYLSPASGRALPRHFDTHDVFVLQLYGKKRWRIYDCPVSVPLEYFPPLRCEHNRQRRARRDRKKITAAEINCELVSEFTLDAGDLLYLPRGFWHVAEAEADSFSCHLTIGIQSFTYLDLMTVALTQVAERDTSLRESLPLRFGIDERCHSEVIERVSNIIRRLPQYTDAIAALDEVAEIFGRTRSFPGMDFLRSHGSNRLADLALNSLLHVRGDVIWSISRGDSNVVLRRDSETFSFESSFEHACRFVASREEFRVSEIPGALSDQQKLSLARALLQSGILWFSEPPLNETMGISCTESIGWLPIKLELLSKSPKVEWMRFGHNPLTEPMFSESVKKLREDLTPAPTKVTDLNALMNFPADTLPTGFIFHISRCGSTLVSNAMRCVPGTIVISEAQVFAPLLTPRPFASENAAIEWENMQRALLLGAVKAFSQRRTGSERALVIKFSSWQIVALSLLRRLFPDVPSVIVIRDPLEVAVSCLHNPPGWMRFRRQPAISERLFKLGDGELRGISDEGFCARVIDCYLKSASENIGPTCRVVDYSNLNASRIRDIAQFLGCDGDRIGPGDLDGCLRTYSKSPFRNKDFRGDAHIKQAAATEEIRNEVRAWTAESYLRLRQLECWQPVTTGAKLRVSDEVPSARFGERSR